MNRGLLTLLFSWILVLNAKAQEPLHMMESRAPLPGWVHKTSWQVRAELIDARMKNGLPITLESNKAIEESVNAQFAYLSSGRLLFNDEAGILANSIADRLLKDDSATRNAINIYVYYSTGTNSVVFPTGLIILELGIFAQSQSEEQLAFQIAHEIAHFQSGDYITDETPFHPSEKFPIAQEIMDFLLDKEVSADLRGMNMCQKAGYEVDRVLEVFDVLQRNWIVPTEIKFYPSFFNDSISSYPLNYYAISEVCNPGFSDAYFEGSQFPSLRTRKDKLINAFYFDSTAESKFSDQIAFLKVNRLAIYNCGLISLENQDIAASVYIGYYLHQTDSNLQDEADLLIAKALYIYSASQSKILSTCKSRDQVHISRPEKFDNLFDWNTNPEKITDQRGYIAGTYEFLSGLTINESSILSVKWCYEYSTHTTRHPEIADLLAANSIEIFSMVNKLPVEKLDSIAIVIATAKVDSITKLEVVRPVLRQNNKPSFEIKTNPTILPKTSQNHIVTFVDSTIYVNTQLKILSRSENFVKLYKQHCVWDDGKQWAETGGRGLQTDSIYFFGNNHIWLREHKRTNIFKINEEVSAEKTKSINTNIENASKTNKVDLINPTSCKPDSLTVEMYNAYCLASRVFNELIQNDGYYYILPVAYREEFISVSNTNHITHALTDLTVTKQFTKIRDPWTFVPFLIIPLTTLGALAYLAPSRCFTYRQSAAYNLQTGRVEFTWIRCGKSNATTGDSNNYYRLVFSTIKTHK